MLPDFSVTPPRRICVLRLSALGDVCHVLPVVRTLQDAWTSAPRVEGIDATFHGFTGKADRRIDWIFVRGVQLESIASITTRWGGRYPSDHFP